MTSKEQERKALSKIEEIVNGLGENSYIATAFKGCFEVARTNIENDWACSMLDRAKSAERKVSELEADVKHLVGVKESMERTCEEYRNKISELQTVIENTKFDCEDAEHRASALAVDNQELVIANQELVDKFETESHDMAEQLAAKDMEIMKLKAKLYDLMMATK